MISGLIEPRTQKAGRRTRNTEHSRSRARPCCVLRSAFLVLGFSFFVLTPAAAQEAPPAVPELSPAEIQRLFDGYVVIQAQQALGLSDQQFAQFVPRLRALQETRRRHQQERSRLLSELQRAMRPAAREGTPADEAFFKERLTALQELESRFAADARRAYNVLDEVLDVRQQARFRIFEEQIERKKLDLLLRARQNQNRQMPKRPPG